MALACEPVAGLIKLVVRQTWCCYCGCFSGRARHGCVSLRMLLLRILDHVMPFPRVFSLCSLRLCTCSNSCVIKNQLQNTARLPKN
ncbi:hypothetical protein Hanom_Chr11g00995121 [Helianthus anomalus]